MTLRFALVPVLALPAVAQQPPFTLDQVLSAAFPTSLTASPTGARVAWVSNTRGVRNILVAEPPRYQARAITSYTADDGQELDQLRWLPDASSIVYLRGGTANPASDPKGVSEELWIASLDGSAPRRIGDGADPAVSPRGDRVAFTLGGQIWLASTGAAPAPAPAFRARGTCRSPLWSPDGSRIAFVTARGDHSLVAVYDTARGTLRYLDPSTDYDSAPAWSPDGRSLAFIRTPSNGLRPVRQANRTGEPWSIRIASAETGAGRELWRAAEGPGSVFRDLASSSLFWTASGRIVFPWESGGWTHLYSITPEGGRPVLLTPGRFEVEQAAPAPGGRDIVFSSNQGDIDRRHLWTVPAAGGSPTALTTGTGIEITPAPTSDPAVVAFFRSDAGHPLRPAIRTGSEIRDLDPRAIPADFPLNRMVTPQPVVFSAADGLDIHGQLFLPPAGAAARAPAIVFLHGGPRRQMLLGWHYMYYYSNAYAFNQYLANAGYVVLSVNFRSGIGYGLDFREALHYGASGASELADVQGAGVYLRARPDVDPSRIGVWGGSYGGFLTALALARASDLFKAGVDFHGVHNWATELGIPAGEPDYQVAFQASPLNFVDTWRSPVLLIHADDDPDVQFNQTVRLAFALRRRKVDIEELIIPDETHDFLMHRTWRDTYAAAVAFFKRKL
jgi:dipeptidyl aminopeptidase/acylaminoacyl peptidase